MFHWYIFTALILLMISIDLGMLKKKKPITIKNQIKWSVIWVTVALIFNIYIWYIQGFTKATEFLIGYIIEKSLSIDNVFVFLIIFKSFNIPLQYQKKVLLWGIIGAIILRALFIWLGVVFIEKFSWSFYVFGALLLYNAFQFCYYNEKNIAWSQLKIIKWISKIIPISNQNNGQFFIRKGNNLQATPLIIVLIAIEFSDVVFAIDSIPAIFAITQDPYIILTSNIFAILGLRSLFFVISRASTKFKYLHYGLSVILGFIGIKMLLHKTIDFSWLFSLFIIASSLLVSIMYSIVKKDCE